MMGQYSIKELEQLSGIKAHTIRAWEKRYGLIEPQRTDTNIRYYSDADLKKIINVALLNSKGIKISKIAGLSVTDISQKVTELSQTHDDTSIHINQLTAAMVDLDEEKFEKSLSGLFLRYNFEQSVTEIVYPFLEKIGILWQTNHITPGQEHFISNLIRQKMIVAIDGLPLPGGRRKKALLFLPEGELHEIGLLFYHYLARKAGYRTLYLGQTVPHADLRQVYASLRPQVLITCITSPLAGSSLDDYLKLLVRDFPRAQILLSGLRVQDLDSPCPSRRMKIFRNVHELKPLLLDDAV